MFPGSAPEIGGFIRKHCQSASDTAVANVFRFGLFGSRQVQADGKRGDNPQPG